MANFGEWKKLPSLTTNSSLFVRHIKSNDSLLCTTSRKHVDICDLEDGRSKHTWSLSQSHQLTSPVVFDPKQEDFAVVVNNATLHKWQETTKDILKGRKTSLEGNVYTLTQSGEQEPILLFEDGRIARSSSPNDSLSPAHNKQILWADIIQHDEKINMVCEVVKGSAGCEAMVYRVKNDTQLIQPELIRLQDVQCTGYCLQKKYEAVCLVTLSSDGRLCRYTLSGGSFGEREEMDTPVEMGEGALLQALDDSHIAITQTKDVNNKQVGIGVWDLKFSTVKAWAAYPVDSKGAPFYLTVIRENLVVGFTSGVYMFRCSITPSTLGSVLGCVASYPSISEENSNQLETLLDPLLDISQTKDYKSFKTAFVKFFKAIKNNPDDTVLIQEKMRDLVKRCLEEKQFFPQQELADLASASLISADQCTDAIEKFAKSNDLHGIKMCLAHIQDIPEAVTVRCLQYFISMDVSRFESETDQEMSDNKEEGRNHVQCPFLPLQADLIQRVLMTSFSEIFLLESLKTLEFDKSIQLLKYLRYLLAKLPEDSNNNNSEQLSQERVVSWLCLILDAHFTQMIISPDAGRILIDIQEIVESKMSYFEGLFELDNIIHHFLQKVNVPKKQYTSDYCIEKLVLQ